MAKVYTAEEWNKKKKIDAEKLAADKKKKVAAAKKKRVDEAKAQGNYLEPSGSQLN